jgi:hypothetical protein
MLSGTYEEVFPILYESGNEKTSSLINLALKSLLEPNPTDRIPAGDLARFIREELSKIESVKESGTTTIDLGEITL